LIFKKGIAMLAENIEIPEVPIPLRIVMANTKRHAALKRAKAKKAMDRNKRRLASA
jgi:hypothetical protein